MKKSKKKISYALYTLLAVVLLVGCSGDSETSSALTEWVKQPITEMTVMELISVVFFIGLITGR